VNFGFFSATAATRYSVSQTFSLLAVRLQRANGNVGDGLRGHGPQRFYLLRRPRFRHLRGGREGGKVYRGGGAAGVYVCPADDYNAQKEEEVYGPTLSPEAMTALDARDSALDHVAQAAVDVWENYAEEGQVRGASNFGSIRPRETHTPPSAEAGVFWAIRSVRGNLKFSEASLPSRNLSLRSRREGLVPSTEIVFLMNCPIHPA
jgi:hypothetical protein